MFYMVLVFLPVAERSQGICAYPVGEGEVWKGSTHRDPYLPQMRISLPTHDLLGEERWLISQRRRARNLFFNGLLLGSISQEYK